jgi:hypothetical protein
MGGSVACLLDPSLLLVLHDDTSANTHLQMRPLDATLVTKHLAAHNAAGMWLACQMPEHIGPGWRKCLAARPATISCLVLLLLDSTSSKCRLLCFECLLELDRRQGYHTDELLEAQHVGGDERLFRPIVQM